MDPSPVEPQDLETPKYYYGRVRAFDTTGNRGPWTSLVKSQPTLIDSAEIKNLTASKIKAGTITSSIIELDGAASIIQSTNFVSGTSGWRIQGDGTAEFSAGVIRGTVKAGSVFIDANNRWKSDASGATIAVPEFNVGSSTNYINWDGSKLKIVAASTNNYLAWDGNTLTIKGSIRLPDDSVPVNEDGAAEAANTLIKTDGFVGGLTLTNKKLFFGQGLYDNENTAFFVGKNDTTNQADFSLGNKLTWNGSTLTVRGNLQLEDGSSAINEDDADEAAEEAAEEAVEGLKDEIYEDGFIGGLRINATKMYYGQGTFNNQNTAFYVGKNANGQADFSLGDKLTWNGDTLSITGNVVITGGSTFVSINDAQNTANTANTNATLAQQAANNAIPKGFAAEDINTYSTLIDGNKIITGSIQANRIAAGSITADRMAANYVYGGTISADQIIGGDITGTSFRTHNDRTHFDSNSYIGKIGVESSEGATQCELYAGSNQGFRVQTSYNGEIWLAGSSIYVNLVQFTSGRSIIGLSTSQGSGSGLVVSDGQVYRTSSKRELKENIEDFNNIALIDGLRPRTFTWKVFPGQFKEETEEQKLRRESSVNVGFIAEEVEEVGNGLLSIYNYEEGGNVEVEMYKHLDILALAVASIQDLRKRVAELESN